MVFPESQLISGRIRIPVLFLFAFFFFFNFPSNMLSFMNHIAKTVSGRNSVTHQSQNFTSYEGLELPFSRLLGGSDENTPVMQETPVQSLGWEDPLEKGIAIHSSILAWRIPWTQEPGGLQSMELQRVLPN